jgi:hypothetical protein
MRKIIPSVTIVLVLLGAVVVAVSWVDASDAVAAFGVPPVVRAEDTDAPAPVNNVDQHLSRSAEASG